MRSFARIVMPALRQVRRDIRKAEKDVSRASRAAVKVEGFRLMKLLKAEIKEGAPGGRTFSPLTEIAKRHGRPINRKPLSRLAVAVRYNATADNNNGLAVEVGFLDSGRKKVSKSWLKIARFHQAGGKVEPRFSRKMLGRIFAWTGAKLKKRSPDKARYFFLRKSTVSFRAPARPIIDPFWAAHRAEAASNIRQNFRRKMRGERI